MSALLIIGTFSWFMLLALGQRCTTPYFFDSTDIIAVGHRLFEEVIDVDCDSALIITGPVYLHRPNDPTFVPLDVGYWNGLDDTLLSNNMVVPPLSQHGYGFRVTILPDHYSPTNTPQTSDTFTIVTRTWFDASNEQIMLHEPYYGIEWSEDAEYFLAWQVNASESQPALESFAIYLYNANDLSWGPLLLGRKVNNIDYLCEPYSFAGKYEHYIRFPRDVPLGFGYQVVLTDGAGDTSKVIAVTRLINILSYPIVTTTAAYGSDSTPLVLQGR